MTNTPPELIEAKRWCDEARRLLKLAKADTGASDSDIGSRVRGIVKELSRLDGQLQGAHPEQYAQFAARFKAIARALKEAAESQPIEVALVDAEALALSRLKKEIRVALLEAGGGSAKAIAKAQKKLDTRSAESADELLAAGTHNYTQVYGPLSDRITTALGWTDVSTPVRAAMVELEVANTAVTAEAAAGRPGKAVGLVASTNLAALLGQAEAVKATFDAAKAAWTPLNVRFQPVLAWAPGGLQPPIAALQTELRAAHTPAAANAAAHEYEDAVPALDDATLLAKVDKAVAEQPLSVQYAAERPVVDQLRAEMKAHAQALHVMPERRLVREHLDRAGRRANSVRYQQALDQLALAKTQCETGKDRADDFGAFKIEYAKTAVIVRAMEGAFADDSKWEEKRDALEAANTKADDERRYDEATAECQAVLAYLKGRLERWYDRGLKKKVDALVAQVAGRPAVQAFIQPDLDRIEELRVQIDADIKASRWSRALWEGQQRARGLATVAKKYATRRIEFDDERQLLQPKVDNLKGKPRLQSRMISVNLSLRQADFLASREVLRIDRGRAILARLTQECTELDAIAAVADDYVQKRERTGTELSALEPQADAAQLQPAVHAIRGILEQADYVTTEVDDDDADWQAGLSHVAQAQKDITAAKATAAGLAAVVGAETTARDATSASQLSRAIVTTRAQIGEARKQDHAQLVRDELDRALAAVGEIADELDDRGLDIAKAQLQRATSELITARRVQLQHAAFVAEQQAIATRKDAVEVPDKVKAAIDEVTKELAAADGPANKRDYEAAGAALHRAAAAVERAEEAARRRKAFDTASTAFAAVHTAMPAGAEKDTVAKIRAEALRHAEALDFDRADRAQQRGEAHVEIGKMQALATADADANAATILAGAEKVIDQGDEQLVDRMVANMGAASDLELLKKLAEKRFGFTMDIEIDAADADHPTAAEVRRAVEAAKKMWEMFAKVPGDSRKNPSLRTVKRTKPGTDGGFYRSSEDLVVMHGRPGSENQKFGANLSDELPDDIPEMYQPVNDDPIDYFDFATLHEVGHAVDDRHNFMGSREGNETFGGWRTYGGNVKPIADAVVKEHGYDVDYVQDLILGKSPDPIDRPADVDEATWDAQKRKVDEWYATASANGIWWDNAKSQSIVIGGRVYQEAYKKKWVSYWAGARSRGLTGYQFRAPGEWFAELYAAYYSGKLKKSHPAARWLKELSA